MRQVAQHGEPLRAGRLRWAPMWQRRFPAAVPCCPQAIAHSATCAGEGCFHTYLHFVVALSSAMAFEMNCATDIAFMA